MKGARRLYDLGDRVTELQQWCVDNCVPSWGTGIGLMEAADHIIEEAEANGNVTYPKDRQYTEDACCIAWKNAVEHIKQSAGGGLSYMATWIRKSAGDHYTIRHIAVREVDLRPIVVYSRIADPNEKVVLVGQFLTMTCELKTFLRDYRLKEPDEYRTRESG